MIQIILSICLLSNPAKCHDENLTFVEADISVFSCMRYGQIEIARHMVYRPRWRVNRWKCERVEAETARL